MSIKILLMLRDRIVCGIRDEKIQRRLLVERALTFAKAYEIATSMEIFVEARIFFQASSFHVLKLENLLR